MIAIVAALACALAYATGSVLQQRAAAARPSDESLQLRLLAQLVRRVGWVAGFLVDCAGYGLEFIALAHGTVVVVQPLLLSGLLFALPLGAWLSKRRIGKREWLGAALVVLGLVSFAVASRPKTGDSDAPALDWVLTFAIIIGGVLLAAGLSRKARPGAKAAALGVAAGLMNAMVAAVTKSTATAFEHGIVRAFATWKPYAVGACAATALLLAASAFQAGHPSASLAGLFTTEPIAGITVGAFLFNESLSTAGLAPLIAADGLALAVAGVIVLANSPIVQAATAEPLPSPVRRVPSDA